MLARAAVIAAMLAVARLRWRSNPTTSIRKCGSSSWKTSCGSSPARTRSCSTATGSSRSSSGSCRPAPCRPAGRRRPNVAASAAQPAQAPAHRFSRRPMISRSRPRRRSSRSRQRRSRKAAAAAMPSIPARIPTRPARRARSAAASCRSRAKRRSALPAAAGRRAARSRQHGRPSARCRRRSAAAAHPGATAALTTLPPSATPKRRIRSRHRLHAAQGLCAGRGDHAQFRAEISGRSAARGFAILARRKLFPAPEISRRRGILSRRDDQIRHFGESAGRACCGSASRWRR